MMSLLLVVPMQRCQRCCFGRNGYLCYRYATRRNNSGFSSKSSGAQQQPSSSSSSSHRSSLSKKINKKIFTYGSILFSIGVSLYTRHWRNQKLKELDYCDNDESSTIMPRSKEEILTLVERSGLMGKPGTKSVKQELKDIRKWHTNHGYKGGLVVRELSQPLFAQMHDAPSADGDGFDDPLGIQTFADDYLHQRECYYLYYEITPTGEIKHEIFCRGTTLMVDVWTSLSTWMEYDEDLGCRVHMGFNRQAKHILDDLLPLLAPPGPRTTVRVSGHSLGGSVAFLLAAKLRLYGYRVVQVTSIEAPRICATDASAQILQSLLPKDTLRIENDVDPVPLLPPFGSGVGNKLYLVDGEVPKAAYFPVNTNNNWTDSVFINARLWEIASSRGQSHRIHYVLSQLKASLGGT